MEQNKITVICPLCGCMALVPISFMSGAPGFMMRHQDRDGRRCPATLGTLGDAKEMRRDQEWRAIRARDEK